MPTTKQQRDLLENAALQAFSGNLARLEHGFRIQTGKGQVAAVYWSNVHPGNDVEIAVADNRLTDTLDLRTVLLWLRHERNVNPAPCNVHKHGSDWPIFGFRFDAALAFLKRCRMLRIGYPTPELTAQLSTLRDAESGEQLGVARLQEQLSALRPTRQQAVIDLVRRAGISVQPWYVRADGTPCAMPRSNPNYCFNWAFGGGKEPSLACIWHASLAIADGFIQMQGSVRGAALRLEAVAEDASAPKEQRDRARMQAARARQQDALFARAAAHGTAIRVIVNEGDMSSESDLGSESSVVRVRHLDSVDWHLVRYDEHGGEFVLRRSSPPGSRQQEPNGQRETRPRYADQHDVPGTDSPERNTGTGSSFARDAAVRALVLERAAGRCELCDAPGFQTKDGRLYVETHHVIPLRESGSDRVWNVVALCPNHHREAHSGARSAQLRAELLQMLDEMHPSRTRAEISA